MDVHGRSKKKLMNLRLQALNGAKWAALSMIIVTLFQLAQLFILARYLSPADFGLIAILMVVMGFAQSFMDMGVSNAIIHNQRITHNQLSSLYWLNIASGLFLFIALVLMAPIIVDFYASARLLKPLLLLSAIFIIVSLSSQYQVLYKKELMFDFIAKVEISSAAFGFIIAVTLAIKGAGIYAIVFAMLAKSSLSSALYLQFGLRDHHVPALLYKHGDLKELYSFGFYQMGERSINYISANIDKLIIGKVLGMQALGFYNMAWQMIIFPLSKINPVVNNVAFPVYAKVQDDTLALNKYYAITVKTLSLITVPLLAYLSIFSFEIVFIAFGPGWEEAASLITILAYVGILKALANPGGAILLAQGYANIGFWWNLLWLLVVGIGIYSTLVLKPYVEMVPIVLLALSISFGLIWHYIISRVAKIHYLGIAIHFIKVIAVSFIIGWVVKFIINSIQVEMELIRLLITGAIYLFIYGLYLILFEKEIINQIRKGEH